MPTEFMETPSAFLGNVAIPFIAIWAIVLGFLKTLRIFEGSEKLQIILSFAIAFITGITRGMVIIVSALLSIAGAWAVGGFVFIFIIGVSLYSWAFWKKGRAGEKVVAAYKTAIDRYHREYDKLADELAKELKKPNPDANNIANLKRKMEELKEKMEETKRAMEI
jgi:hypothetical protein